MNFKSILKMASAVAFASSILSLSNISNATEYELTLAHSGEVNHPWHAASQRFIKNVEEMSQGRIKFTSLFTAGEMGGEREMAESLQQGTLDMILIATMGMSSFDKNLMILDFPYLFPTYDKAYEVLDGEAGQKIADSLDKKGFHVLAYLENDYRGFSNSKRAIHSPSDLKGLKLRVPESPVLVEWMKTIDADPTIMPFNEVYSALQTGVVDGQDNGVLLSYTHKVYEVQKYYSLTNHIYCPSPLYISSQVFSSMPKDLQDILTKAAIDARDFQRDLNKEYRAKYEKAMQEAGVEINELTPEEMAVFVESARAVWPKFADKVDKDIYDSVMKSVM